MPCLNNLSDEELVDRARKGSVAPFQALFERYRGPLWNFLLRQGAREDQAEDLFQTTFLKVFRALPSFRIEGRFRTWLYTIAVNVLNDERRAARRRGPTTELREVTMPVHGTAQDSVHRAEDMERVRAVLSGVRRDQRQLFVLVRLGGLRVAEAAGTVGMSISAARMTLLRIGERLGQELSSLRENSE